ncbi:MAG TPA: nuclear transport factor 2 family protein [Ramlibacter sp.]|nr:nuclear transport factor 2 family protein [Ramlibacter sp.]
MSNTSASIRDRAEQLLARYCSLLDADRLEDWCGLFAEAGRYRVLSRENEAQGLPGAILLLENRAMVLDRVTALRQAAVYNAHFARHFYSALQAQMEGDQVRFTANVGVYQSDPDGHTRLFCVGEYRGLLAAEGPPLLEMDVVIDTFAVPTLMAVPV